MNILKYFIRGLSIIVLSPLFIFVPYILVIVGFIHALKVISYTVEWAWIEQTMDDRQVEEWKMGIYFVIAGLVSALVIFYIYLPFGIFN